jgi:hypothetical protein
MDGSAQAASGGSAAAVDERVRRLEAQVDALTEAVEVLARGLADGPLAEPRDRHTEEAARRTHELLLLAKSAAAGRSGTG